MKKIHNCIVIFVCKKRKIDVNNQNKLIADISNVTTTNSKSCYIFAAHFANAYGKASGVRVFNAKISLNDAIVKNFIPCYSKTSVNDVNEK